MSISRLYFVVLLFATAAIAAAAPIQAATVAKISVRDVNGKSYNLVDQTKRATVLLFSAVDCPISNGYAPEVNRLIKKFTAQKISFLIVYPDTDIDASKARKHARDFGYSCPLVLDAKQILARRFGASVTPEAVVLSRQGKVLYRGRIDDRYVTWGKKRRQPSRRELFDALQSIARGQRPTVSSAPAIGCFIPNLGSAS